jgi:hypothetical protein
MTQVIRPSRVEWLAFFYSSTCGTTGGTKPSRSVETAAKGRTSHEEQEQALAKLDAFAIKIGYPDRWRDYSALAVEDTAFVLNVFAANRFETARLRKVSRELARRAHRLDISMTVFAEPRRSEGCLAPSLSRPVEGVPILSRPPAGGLRRSTDGA